jgi:thioredoxin reductase (NADPH)
LRRQLGDVSGTIVEAEATGLEARPGGVFRVRAGELTLLSRTVLLATGVVDKAPLIPGLEPVIRRGLLRQCPICDGHEHAGQRIAVLGDGPHAQREAVFISHFSSAVSLATLTPDACSTSASRDPGFVAACGEARVRLLGSPVAQARLDDDSVTLLLQDGSAHTFDVLYAALGCHPRSALASKLGAALDDTGQMEVDSRCRTSIPGLYAAGDVVSGLDQLAVAIGHGAIAATAIHNGCREYDPGVIQPAPPSVESALSE